MPIKIPGLNPSNTASNHLEIKRDRVPQQYQGIYDKYAAIAGDKTKIDRDLEICFFTAVLENDVKNGKLDSKTYTRITGHPYTTKAEFEKKMQQEFEYFEKRKRNEKTKKYELPTYDPYKKPSFPSELYSKLTDEQK